MALRLTPSLPESSFSEGSLWPGTNLLVTMYSRSWRSTRPDLLVVSMTVKSDFLLSLGKVISGRAAGESLKESPADRVTKKKVLHRIPGNASKAFIHQTSDK